ncbi:uncharacterized protein LOC113355818 [Papaver somniferum]|uniref:uncharacterized protein LOC113355818 n=1 Tax=Papaver somniferum TaxID=3469 RepID=UPI000E701FF8|nr:uncharacterized protein LOC113355818 [Papaver somniferum]
MDASVVDLSNSPVESPSIDLINNAEERYDAWKFSLIGRLDLTRLKFSEVVLNMKNQWKLEGQCKMIPLGKGFFTIKLDNEKDKMGIKAGKWEVGDQVLWIRNWIPGFKPENHRTSSAMIWVHLPGLSLEYWDEQTLFTICRALGTPVKVDETTLNYDNGYYARVLMNIDLANKIPNKLWIKTKFGGFMQSVMLAKPPKFCDHCKIVRHLKIECRVKNSSPKEPVPKQSVNTTPKSTNTSNRVKFDISDPSLVSSSQAKGFSSNTSSREVEHCETPIMQFNQFVGVGHQLGNPVNITTGMFGSLQDTNVAENIIEMHEDSVTLSPAKVLQIVEDNALENSVIKYINGKEGTMTEEQIPTTSWSKIISKPSSTKQGSSSNASQTVGAPKVTSQQILVKYNFRKNQNKGGTKGLHPQQ